MPGWSKSSQAKLDTCDPRIIEILDIVVKHHDCKVLWGHRTEQQQNDLYDQIPRVTHKKWPDSKHNSLPSIAVDVAPWPIPHKWGKDWIHRVKFYELKAAIFLTAAQLGYTIRWGGDWDMDKDYTDNTFNDLVHFEVLD